MNWLADRHHAGLFRSLQLLAARMGANLFTPVGREWMTEGYWNFGLRSYGDDRLAVQYLEPHDGVWVPEPDSYVYATHHTTDTEFPDAPIRGVTLHRARQMSWSHVVATLDDNQQGFARFAREVGAQYVYQVGNTRQYVDWSLDPLALVSSEVPIHGRGIRYHQEMDPAIAFRQPSEANRTAVSSFVNCFPQVRRDHQYIGQAWDEAKTLLPEWDFREYGIDGEHGIIKPIDRFALHMGAAMFVWMDKPTGDGFGHVIHSAAAIGRPIIGHGWHYAGKMAEVFWTPETSIDLDIHSVSEAVDLIRHMDGATHAAMCRNIRAIFEATVDYDAEAQQIRELLTAQGAVAEMSMA